MDDSVRRAQDEFDDAERRGDKETLRRLLADDFVSIGPRGFLMDKQQWVDRHDRFAYEEQRVDEMDVRLYGETAVVRDIHRDKARYADHHVEIETRVSQVWVRQDGPWRLAAIQFSPLAPEAAGRTDEQTRSAA